MTDFKKCCFKLKTFHQGRATRSEVVYLRADETGAAKDAGGEVVIRINEPR